MSTNHVKLALKSVIMASVPSVVVLKGKWGRGKTHLWRDSLRKFAGFAPDRWNRYAYVSLFGVESLAELRDAVLANGDDWRQLVQASRPPEDEAPPPDILQRTVARVRTGIRRALAPTDDLTEMAGKLHAGGISHALLLRGVRRYLVCIDDLERRGSHLRLRDALGYLATLRDDRECSVLLILNDDELTPEDRAEFALLREKVFDHEVAFDPTADDCVELVFPKEEPAHDLIRASCVALGIENIRVLHRIAKAYERLRKESGTGDRRALERLARSVPLCALCFYSREAFHPPFAYLRARLPGGEGAEGMPDAARWSDFLARYEGWTPSALDAVVVASLEQGYVDREALTAALR